MRKLLLATISIVGFSAAALAEQSDQITVEACSPMSRTTIIGVVGEPTTIKFPDGQNIYRIVQTNKVSPDGALQDDGWSEPNPEEAGKRPLDNVVPLWPTKVGTSTMTIMTKPNETSPQMVYPFRLVAISPEDAAKPGANVTLNLVCGKGPPPAAAVQAASAVPHAPWTGPVARPGAQYVAGKLQPTPEAVAAAQREIKTQAFNSFDGKCHYSAHGPLHSPIAPQCPMSNGVWTLMRFPGLQGKPAVYVVTGDNNERLARQHGTPDFVVVEEIAPHFRLRLGEEVLDLLADDTFSPAGNPTNSGTLSPTVGRELLQAAKGR